MNCLNANFYDPDLMSMAEKLVMKKQGGAIAFWGSTSITPPSVQHTYQKAFYEQMLKNPSSDLGGNVKVSKALGAQISPFNELIMSWTILGDPMVKPVLPVQNKSVEQEELTKSSNLHASSGCALVASSGKMSYAVSWDLLLALVLEFLISLTVIRSLQRVLR